MHKKTKKSDSTSALITVLLASVCFVKLCFATFNHLKCTFALLHPPFGFRFLLFSLLLELLANFLVGEPVHLLAGLITVNHLEEKKQSLPEQ